MIFSLFSHSALAATKCEAIVVNHEAKTVVIETYLILICTLLIFRPRRCRVRQGPDAWEEGNNRVTSESHRPNDDRGQMPSSHPLPTSVKAAGHQCTITSHSSRLAPAREL